MKTAKFIHPRNFLALTLYAAKSFKIIEISLIVKNTLNMFAV